MKHDQGRLDSAAHSGAFGQGSKCRPSADQLRAGNYAKGHLWAFGLPLVIETPMYQPRCGKADGKPFATVQQAHYGYIRGTKGADGDEVDCFVGPALDSELVFVVNQHNKAGEFDEHKVMLGFLDVETARAAYLGSYELGWTGLGSIVPASLRAFKRWLKSRASSAPQPFQALEGDDVEEVKWTEGARLIGADLADLMFRLRAEDAGEGAMLDSMTMADIDEAHGAMMLDAMVMEYRVAPRKIEQLRKVMVNAGQSVKPESAELSKPFKSRGTTQVAVLFQMTDGQTVTVFFHNPDSTPNKLRPDDELVSWKWMLNKKDVTIIVAPERGQDINPREVGRRIMRLVEKNSEKFQKANAAKAEELAEVEGLKGEVEAKAARIAALDAEIERLEQMAASGAGLVPPTADPVLAPAGVPSLEQFALYVQGRQREYVADERAKMQAIIDGSNPQAGIPKYQRVTPEMAHDRLAGLDAMEARITEQYSTEAMRIAYEDKYGVAAEPAPTPAPAEPGAQQGEGNADLIEAGFKQVGGNEYVKVAQAGDKRLQYNVRISASGFRGSLTIGFSGGFTGAKIELGVSDEATKIIEVVQRDIERRAAEESGGAIPAEVLALIQQVSEATGDTPENLTRLYRLSARRQGVEAATQWLRDTLAQNGQEPAAQESSGSAAELAQLMLALAESGAMDTDAVMAILARAGSKEARAALLGMLKASNSDLYGQLSMELAGSVEGVDTLALLSGAAISERQRMNSNHEAGIYADEIDSFEGLVAISQDGGVVIQSIGSENLYFRKGDKPYYTKLLEPDTFRGMVGAVVDLSEYLPDQKTAQPESMAAGQAAAEPAVTVEPEAFRHEGFNVYPIRSGAGVRWAVQSIENLERENAGERQIGGDTIVGSADEGRVEAERQARELERRAIQRQQEAEAEAAEIAAAEAKAAEYADIGEVPGETPGETPMQRGRRVAALASQLRDSDGETLTLKGFIEKRIDAGWSPVAVEEDRYKELSRTQYSRMNNAEQEAHARKVAEGGKVTAYYLENDDRQTKINKIGYDYAIHYQGKQSAAGADNQNTLFAEPQPAPAQPEATAGDEQLEADKRYLDSIIDGTADLAAGDVLERMEAIYERHGEGALQTLFADAAEAFSQHAVKLAQKALG